MQYKSGLKKCLLTVLNFCIKAFEGYYKQSKLFIDWVSQHNYYVNLVSQVTEKNENG